MLAKLTEIAQLQLDCQLDPDRYILVGNAFNKYSFFLYRIGEQSPACIAKTANTRDGKERCSMEYDVISHLERFKIENIQFPRPLGIAEVGNQTFYLQEYSVGDLLLGEVPILRRRFRREHFQTATFLLANLYSVTREATTVEDRSYSRCFQHRDFWIGNIARADRQLILYDLEFSEISGKPLCDLLHFGIYYFRVLSNIGAYCLKGHTDNDHDQSTDHRVIELQGTDIDTVFGSRNQFSETMYRSIFDYTSMCSINEDDTLELILNFIGSDRDVVNLSEQWKTDTISTFRYWRQRCNVT